MDSTTGSPQQDLERPELCKSSTTQVTQSPGICFLISFLPQKILEHEYCRSLLYRGSLELLSFLLEKSAILSELTNMLCCCTFMKMAQRFPWRLRLAKEAIERYILLVESAEGNPWIAGTVLFWSIRPGVWPVTDWLTFLHQSGAGEPVTDTRF